MYWLQFQSRVRRGTEEPITYFLPTDNINPPDLFHYDVQEKYFAIRVIVISFTFTEAL